ncbi:heterokaryon incompatibility protein-domain-containing protein [Plectosphaerella cucumerina]|uniref:Heterokaryon incompatibility protein-domain-containing protein n=1 Tax=Plectosphaerella cucumerina TaxID=40658 RepID=A0A8K0TDG6_9PEZI|nr:heterokaryon incompatibility protein-domain-containing protein [Plectosphaerella cucumerina]
MSGIWNGLRAVRDTSLWAGQAVARNLTSSMTGICPVCNNLQPHGHEDTLGRTPHSLGRFLRFDGHQPLTDVVQEPALFLPHITSKVLLQCRENDPKTGKPLRDCRYCRLLCDILDDFFIDEYMSWLTDTANGMRLKIDLMIRDKAPLVISCWGAFTHDKVLRNPRADLEVYVEDAADLEVPGIPAVGVGLPRVMDTADPSCTEFAIACLDECRLHHPECGGKQFEFEPTRLLDLGQGDDVIRLCGPRGQAKGWVALSHCWGGHQPLKLLQSNIAQMKERIEISDLPPTFRNAVDLCRKLSLRYLWIDSLCIIQDDAQDWDHEAARMGEIYKYAFLVIIGASSANPETPFLGPRDNEEWGTRSFPFVTPTGHKVTLKARRRHLLAAPLDHGIHDPPFTHDWAIRRRVGPLYKRSWCFQESYLAPRSLHFSPGAVIFECGRHRRTDDSTTKWLLSKPESVTDVPDDVKWRMIVEAYSMRQLTFARDKLTALGGIASLAPQAKAQDQYLAGLWRSTLLLDLMWQIMIPEHRPWMVLTYPPDQMQLAPSWSWASIDQPVVWTQLKGFEPLATVVNAEAPASGESPYGAVSGGRLQLRGSLLACRIVYRREGDQDHVYYVKADGTKSKEQWFLGDGPLVAVDERVHRYRSGVGSRGNDFDVTAYFLCLGRTDRWHMDHVGLVLTASEDHPDCMERIGSIMRVRKEWYDDGWQTVVNLA